MKTIKLCLLLFFYSCLVSCGQIGAENSLDSDRLNNTVISDTTNSNLTEVATPKIIKELNLDLEQYIPQVKIISPHPEETLDRTDISINLEVEDLPIFQDDKLKLGNHLNLILDNEPYQQIYSLDEPVILKDLTPGTHTIRVFAVRPWGESFKNEGAYAQTTFNVLTETNDNRPESNLPLLTYNNPTGTYGAEPLMLDFYLTKASLQDIAQNDYSLKDWRIRATVNGVSFIIENWQPIYLTGFKQGENWIQLELIDEAGNDLENTFNNTVRVITYEPQKEDALAQLVTNKISLAEAQSVIEPYYIESVETEIVELDDSTKPTDAPEEPIETVEPQIETADNASIKNTNEPSVTTAYIPEEPIETLDTEIEIDDSDRPEQTIAVILKSDRTESEATSPEVDVDNSKATPNLETVTESKAESEPSAKVIIITEVDSDNEGNEDNEATIEIPQQESVKITEAEVAITIPKTETDNLPEPTPQKETRLWWKKILVNLRQKIEGLARLLPDRV